jgi:hypothetical protein
VWEPEETEGGRRKILREQVDVHTNTWYRSDERNRKGRILLEKQSS